MAANRSTAFCEAIASRMPYAVAMANGRLKYYTGSRPASADLAPTGSLLGTFTLGGGTFTAEVRATAVVVLSAFSATASIDSCVVGGSIPLCGAVSSAVSLADLTNKFALAINNYTSIPKFTAVSNGVDTVTISAPVGLGAGANGLTLVITDTNVTTAINAGNADTFGTTGATAGVTSVNGCNFQSPDADGVLTKETTAWQMTAIASGTVGYARWEFDPSDNQSDDSTNNTYRRMDLTVGTSGADLNVGTTTIVAGQVYTVDSGTFTAPKS